MFLVDESIFFTRTNDFFSSENFLVTIEAIEQNKNIDYIVNQILPFLSSNSVTRRCVIIAIGGGIVQDLAGFAASSTLRGVPWIFLPTTLLAQGDSCIGSKSSLNYRTIKNYIGGFYPPKQIVLDVSYLDTLTTDDFQSGIGEVLKIFLLESRKACTDLIGKIEKLYEREGRTTEYLIRECLRFKKSTLKKMSLTELDVIY